jgi:hypothetical protein
MSTNKKERETIIIDTGVETDESARPLDVDEIIDILENGDNTVVLSRTDDPNNNVKVRFRDKADQKPKYLN